MTTGLPGCTGSLLCSRRHPNIGFLLPLPQHFFHPNGGYAQKIATRDLYLVPRLDSYQQSHANYLYGGSFFIRLALRFRRARISVPLLDEHCYLRDLVRD